MASELTVGFHVPHMISGSTDASGGLASRSPSQSPSPASSVGSDSDIDMPRVSSKKPTTKHHRKNRTLADLEFEASFRCDDLWRYFADTSQLSFVMGVSGTESSRIIGLSEARAMVGNFRSIDASLVAKTDCGVAHLRGKSVAELRAFFQSIEMDTLRGLKLVRDLTLGDTSTSLGMTRAHKQHILRLQMDKIEHYIREQNQSAAQANESPDLAPSDPVLEQITEKGDMVTSVPLPGLDEALWTFADRDGAPGSRSASISQAMAQSRTPSQSHGQGGGYSSARSSIVGVIPTGVLVIGVEDEPLVGSSSAVAGSSAMPARVRELVSLHEKFANRSDVLGMLTPMPTHVLAMDSNVSTFSLGCAASALSDLTVSDDSVLSEIDESSVLDHPRPPPSSSLRKRRNEKHIRVIGAPSPVISEDSTTTPVAECHGFELIEEAASKTPESSRKEEMLFVEDIVGDAYESEDSDIREEKEDMIRIERLGCMATPLHHQSGAEREWFPILEEFPHRIAVDTITYSPTAAGDGTVSASITPVSAMDGAVGAPMSFHFGTVAAPPGTSAAGTGRALRSGRSGFPSSFSRRRSSLLKMKRFSAAVSGLARSVSGTSGGGGVTGDDSESEREMSVTVEDCRSVSEFGSVSFGIGYGGYLGYSSAVSVSGADQSPSAATMSRGPPKTAAFVSAMSGGTSGTGVTTVTATSLGTSAAVTPSSVPTLPLTSTSSASIVSAPATGQRVGWSAIPMRKQSSADAPYPFRYGKKGSKKAGSFVLQSRRRGSQVSKPELTHRLALLMHAPIGI